VEPAEVVLLGAGSGWHTARLEAALAAEGLASRRLAFSACGFQPGMPGLRLGRRSALPAAALVRSIPAGSFEQVTLRLGLLHALERLEVPVLNSPVAIERCVDKAATSFLLAASGLPTPPAWTVETAAVARRIVVAEADAGHELVLKPLFGAQGTGLRRITDPADLPPAEAVGGVWHLQRYVGQQSGWRDYRVFVVAGRAIAAMIRHGAQWITNVRQGGVPAAVPARDRGAIDALAIAAAEATGTFYAGVDLIESPDGLAILEVNSMPAWQGLQSVAGTDIARELAVSLRARLRRC
jgi:RimK family alpha-L-glutamate ligase